MRNSSALLLAWNLLFNQTALAQTPPTNTEKVLETTVSRVIHITVSKSSASTVSKDTDLESPYSDEKAYLASVESFKTRIAERLSVEIGGFRLWVVRDNNNLGFTGRSIAIKRDFSTKHLISESTGRMEAGMGNMEGGGRGIFIRAKIDF